MSLHRTVEECCLTWGSPASLGLPPLGHPSLTPLSSFRYGGRLGLAGPPRLPPAPPAPRLLLAGSATGCVVLGLLRTAARCQEATVPAVPPGVPGGPEPPESPSEPPFDWPLFWTFLRPQLLALSAAVVVSRGEWVGRVPLSLCHTCAVE